MRLCSRDPGRGVIGGKTVLLNIPRSGVFAVSESWIQGFERMRAGAKQGRLEGLGKGVCGRFVHSWV